VEKIMHLTILKPLNYFGTFGVQDKKNVEKFSEEQLQKRRLIMFLFIFQNNGKLDRGDISNNFRHFKDLQLPTPSCL